MVAIQGIDIRQRVAEQRGMFADNALTLGDPDLASGNDFASQNERLMQVQNGYVLGAGTIGYDSRKKEETAALKQNIRNMQTQTAIFDIADNYFDRDNDGMLRIGGNIATLEQKRKREDETQTCVFGDSIEERQLSTFIKDIEAGKNPQIPQAMKDLIEKDPALAGKDPASLSVDDYKNTVSNAYPAHISANITNNITLGAARIQENAEKARVGTSSVESGIESNTSLKTQFDAAHDNITTAAPSAAPILQNQPAYAPPSVGM